MNSTVIAIRDEYVGDVSDVGYATAFIEEINKINDTNIKTEIITFEDAYEDRLPFINSEQIVVMQYFPWEYRNRNINNFKLRDGHYGGKLHKKSIDDYYNKVDQNLRKMYDDKLTYINSPQAICLDRDKKSVKKILNENGITTPIMYETKNVDETLDLLETNNLFIKFRVGGEGKGITYLTKDKWMTNIDWDPKYQKTPFVDTHINPFQTDWRMHDVTENREFLDDLLQRFIIIEKEVDFPTIDNMKYDLRMYMIYNEPAFILPRTANPENIVTNWSRGGAVPSGEDRIKFINQIPQDAIELAKETASRASKVIGANLTGLDIIFSKDYDKAYVLEGQTDPGYTKQFDIPKALAEATYRNLIK